MHPSVRFSVIVPCFNQGAFIQDCLESLLAQTLAPLEVLVVNDGSTDDATVRRLEQVCQGPVRLIHQENRGLSGARNSGIRQAIGDWIVPLDCDDALEPDALEAYAEAISGAPDVSVWYPDIHHFGLQSARWNCPDFNQWRQLWMNQLVCSSAINRRVFDAGVTYNERMRSGYEDWEFYIHALVERGFRARPLKKAVFKYRKWGYSMLSESDSRRTEIVDQIQRERPIYRDPPALLAVKQASAPFFAVAAQTPQLARALGSQTLRDFRIVDEEDTATAKDEGLACARGAGANSVLVSLADGALIAAMRADPFLLEKLARIRMKHNPGLIWLMTEAVERAYPGQIARHTLPRESRCVGVVVSNRHLFAQPELEKTDAGLIVDLRVHFGRYFPESELQVVVGPHSADGIHLERGESQAQLEVPPPRALQERVFLVGQGLSKIVRGVIGHGRHDRVLSARPIQAIKSAAGFRGGWRRWIPHRRSLTGEIAYRPIPHDPEQITQQRYRDPEWFLAEGGPLYPPDDPKGALLVVTSWVVHGGVDRAAVDLISGVRRADPDRRIYLLTTQAARMAWAPEVLRAVSGVFPLDGPAGPAMSEAIVALVLRLGVSAILLANSQQAADALPLLRRKAPDVRVVVQAHNFETDPLTGDIEGQAAYVASRFNNLVASYTAISSSTEETLSGRLYVSPSKVRRVYLGIDTRRFAKARHACFSGEGPARVLWLGRLCHQKDPLLLVRIAALWQARNGRDCLHFDVVGAGELGGEVQAAIRAEGVASLVTLHGAVDDPIPYYRSADCLMLTSRYEGIPVVVFEAMAAGLPIITPIVESAVQEALDPSSGFFIEDRKNPAEYVALLERLLADPAPAWERSRNAGNVSARFDIQRYADETLAVLDPNWRSPKSKAS